MSNLLTHKHTNRNSSGGGLYQFTGQKVNLPSLGTTTPNVGLFNYLGTNRRTAAFVNPSYNGNGPSFGTSLGLVRVTGSGVSGGATLIQALTDGPGGSGAAISGANSFFSFDFMSDNKGTLIGNKIEISNFVFKPTSFMWIGAGAATPNSGCLAQVSNSGVNWKTLGVVNAGTVPANYAETSFNEPKFWRHFRVFTNPGNVGEVELYGIIQFLK